MRRNLRKELLAALALICIGASVMATMRPGSRAAHMATIDRRGPPDLPDPPDLSDRPDLPAARSQLLERVPRLNTILYGVAYYPEYMPYERLDIDVELMRQAGLNVVRVGESTWSSWEPRDGMRSEERRVGKECRS